MGYFCCLYVDVNKQLVQRLMLQACPPAYFMPFSFQTTPLLASVFCGIRRETYPVTGLDAPLSLTLSIFCAVLTDFQGLVSQFTPSWETPRQLSVQKTKVWSAVAVVLGPCPCRARTQHGQEFNVQALFVTALFERGFLSEGRERAATSRGNVE